MKYLSEEKYEETKKKVTKVSLIILIVGIIIGIIIIGIGITRGISINKNAVEAEKSQEFRKNGFSERYYELESMLRKAESAMAFYLIGGFIIMASIVSSLSIFKSTKRREIAAYMLSQGMPITKEYIENMAPYAGNVAKEISKGIKEGIKSEDNK